jgi:hypothetical protein
MDHFHAHQLFVLYRLRLDLLLPDRLPDGMLVLRLCFRLGLGGLCKVVVVRLRGRSDYLLERGVGPFLDLFERQHDWLGGVSLRGKVVVSRSV